MANLKKYFPPKFLDNLLRLFTLYKRSGRPASFGGQVLLEFDSRGQFHMFPSFFLEGWAKANG